VKHRTLMTLSLFVFFITTGCTSVRVQKAETNDAVGFPTPNSRDVTGLVSISSGIESTSRATRYFWGRKHYNQPERSFAELLAHAAEKHAGMVVYAKEKPDPAGDSNSDYEKWIKKQLEAASEQGHDFLFTAQIKSWTQNYILFFQWARIRYDLTCHYVPEGDRVWNASVRSRKLYATGREALSETLKEIFTTTNSPCTH